MAVGVWEQTATGRWPELDRAEAPPLAFTHDLSGEIFLFPEIDCLRGLLDAETIAAAERRAAEIGFGAAGVLIAAGVVSEEEYLRRLASSLHCAFETFDDVERTHCPLDNERLLASSAAGMLPLTLADELTLVLTPRGAAVRKIIALIEQNPELSRRFRFTTAQRLRDFVFAHSGRHIAAHAADSLQASWPLLSAAPQRWRNNVLRALFIGCLATVAAFAAPAQALLGAEVLLAVIFLAWMALRIAGAFIKVPRAARTRARRDSDLPVYTIVSALYRETTSIEGLLGALERLDYPPEKLDVKIVIESDDDDTRAALATRSSGLPIEIIVAPPVGPRTKPKALNVALPFARGSFLVIYDAEDRPEPEQLRSALHAFEADTDALACVQASLSIDNTADSWLARLYTAEYAGQFDVFLPGIAALRLPLPLGGSSNHFRTATLRAIGGWDAYNVTEDADLGMRLARFGYRAGVIDSTTYEEAPARFVAWLRQRTRWFKGWMQTWLVHMREPRTLLRDLGLPGFLAFQLIVGGNVLAALVHPLFMAGLIYSIASGAPMWKGEGAAVTLLAWLYGSTVAIGYLASAFLGLLGLMRRGLLANGWVLLLTPLHWLLLSLAAWRALYQLLAAPYRWEKTEHGLAKTSRLAARKLTRLERHLTDYENASLVPRGVRDSAAARRRHPRGVFLN